MIVLAIAIICTIIFVIFIFKYSEVLSIAETVLNFIGGALAFIFSPIAFYATTFAIAAGDQNVPIYVFMPVAFFPIEIGLLFFVRAILSGPKIRRVPLEDELAYYFIAEFLVAISVILVSLYVSIMFHLYQKYILLIIGMTIVLVVTLGVRLLRLRLFFPESIRDISETIAYLRRRV
jgi:hypothetical protein